MALRCVAFEDGHAEAWDAFVRRSASGTFLHTRRFLSYHGQRFADRSLLVIDDRDRLLALLPAALDPGDPQVVVSHPGITYGGILCERAARGEALLEVLECVLAHYRALGLERLIYKAVPAMYHRWPAQDDLYALFRCEARLSRRDLSAAVDLARRQSMSERRRRGARRARAAGIEVVQGTGFLEAFWPILSEVLGRRHDARPVHTLEEIRLLAARFPEHVGFVGARLGQALLGGSVLFHTDTVCHAQYIAAGEAGSQAGALDLVFETAIELAREADRGWFDFGISTEAQGRVLNGGLHEFKTGFGAGALTYDFYEVAL